MRKSHLFYIMMLFAACIILMFHLHERTHFNTHPHIVIVYTILLTIISSFAELITNFNPTFSLLHNICLILTGTWLGQAVTFCNVLHLFCLHTMRLFSVYKIGFYLYPPWSWITVWDQNDVKSIVYVNNILTYHMIITCLSTLILMSFFSWKSEYSNECLNKLHITIK
ncbi:hypothetical protein KSF78_0008859 [Schistosoma japonicum]|nr:hypothetical protein KSF78_0008859 [Schistosoma japonicum]